MFTEKLAMQPLFFIGAYGVALCFHIARHRKSLKDPNTHTKAGLAGGVVAVLPDALRDFAIHVVLYSGLVIPGH